MPTLSRISTIVIAFLAMIFMYLIWQGFSNYQGVRDYHQGMANRSVNATANEISILIRSYRRVVQLFAQEHQEELIRLLNDPGNTDLADQLGEQLGAFLPEYGDYALADQGGALTFVLNSDDLGNACRMELMNFARSGLMEQPVKIHTDEHGSHFDIVVSLGDLNQGLFFVSFKLERLKEMLRHGQTTGHYMLLLKELNPRLLALALDETTNTFTQASEAGNNAHDALFQRELTPSTYERIVATSPVPGTQWILADLPAPDLFSKARKAIAQETIVIFLAFLSVSLIMLFLSRREARRTGETAMTIEGIEAERKRIAMDLHDQVLGEITHTVRETSNYVEACSGNPEMQDRIGKLRDSLGIMADGIRTVIDDLHPQALNILGLEAAFRSLLEKRHPSSEKPTWSLTVDEDIDKHLSKGQRLNLYRILLEVSSNVLKHAEADHFFVDISIEGNNQLCVVIEDDGIGFSQRRHHRANSLGIANIQTRARLIQAVVEWQTPASGKGTRFELNMGIQL
jgi:signal transduction histidine kinase